MSPEQSAAAPLPAPEAGPAPDGERPPGARTPSDDRPGAERPDSEQSSDHQPGGDRSARGREAGVEAPGRALLRDVFRRNARSTALGCALSVVHQTCEALVPVAIGLAVDRAVSSGSPAAIAVAVLGVLLLFAVLSSGGGLSFWVLDRTILTEAHRLRVRGIGRVLTDPSVGQDRRAGELTNILTSDARATAESLRVRALLVSASVGLTVSVVVLLGVDLLLGLGVVVVLPLLVLGVDRLGPWLENRVQARQEAGGLAAAVAAELVHALRPLRGFGGVPEAVRRYRIASRRSLGTAVDAATASSALVGVGQIATGLLLVGTTAAAGLMALSGRISVGELVTVVAMASFVADPVRYIADCVKQIAVSRASADRVAALLAPARAEERATDPEPGPLTVRSAGVEFTLKPGEVLGLVVADPAVADRLTALLNGAGPGAWLGDVPLADVDMHVRRRHLHVEPHAAHLLGGSLTAALDTGRATDQAAVDRALAAASAEDVVESLVDGDLHDHGANLSGGQRQRLALARALAADPPLLVLRDPLTAVDAVTEHRVARGVHELRHGTGAGTVVLTTSPPLLSRCDRVVFVAAEVEQAGTGSRGDASHAEGTHADLSAIPAYAEVVLR
ncbi:ABC transporter ATP-binding protein [Actinosynnema pretiosum subsp. pretiosum]|uniref:ABC transporter transmembrane region n=2 Tax=Actinosynnema TaxID=40566 RepID=C6WRV2_ACTMD|nr:ABC transporter ATP-binding protein [Actinosynnema mirum]ACU36944.1 ABC transporter transmembrane region [Actinosynnema mirum DSM 43827]QUF05430.1 ABC transporter ATP-binding protein [Actinosynnema pretiosum subsp. pretiosum]